MRRFPVASDSHLFSLEAPYSLFEPIDTSWAPDPASRGVAIVWFVTAAGAANGELDWMIHRPRGVSCALVLPPPSDIPLIAKFLHRLCDAEPNVVLPSGRLATPTGIKSALTGGPRNLSKAVTEYLWRHRVINDNGVRTEVHRMFQMAPRTATISKLCREMYLSRRTLGRHFEAHGLPVPSHWLQFARLLHVLLRAQAERIAMFKLAIGAGYPDGFTFSNQVKRMTGLRPSDARDLVGYEWLIEAWLAREQLRRDHAIEPAENETMG